MWIYWEEKYSGKIYSERNDHSILAFINLQLISLLMCPLEHLFKTILFSLSKKKN